MKKPAQVAGFFFVKVHKKNLRNGFNDTLLRLWER